MSRSRCFSNKGLNRGAWSAEEDKILLEYIRTHGDGGWRKIPEKAGLKRCGKSCRLRWVNHVCLGIKRGNICPDEEELIVRLHRLLGNRWSLIAGRLPGRTANEIKNYWNTHLKKKPLLVESQSNGRAKSPTLLQNRVFKTTPVRLTTPVKHAEMVTANGCSNQAFSMSTIKENANALKSGCNLLVNDSVTEECIPFEMADANLVQTDQARNSTHFVSSLAQQQSPHCDYFAGQAATLTEILSDLNEPTSLGCNLLSSPSFSTGFELEEFYMGLDTPLGEETNEFQFEDICSGQSNVNSFTFAYDQEFDFL